MEDSAIKILLIDDDQDDLVITRDILDEISHVNYQLEWAMTYQEAYDRMMKAEHDIYLIDYRLGEQDGITLIAKAAAAGVTAPLILLTGKGDQRIDMLAMEQGAADFLVKGEITPALMERTIRHALNHYKTIQLLKESEHKFRQLFERNIDAIYISDIDHKVMDANPALLQLLDCENDDIIGKNLSCVFVETKDYEDFAHKLEKKHQYKNYEAHLKSQQDSILLCQITAVERLNHKGEPIGYQGIIHDITLQKKAERELLSAERLSMTGKLARSIAHEVRNPLTNLGLALEQLQDEITEDQDDAMMFLDIIKRNSDRIGQLITELLNSSKPKELTKTKYNPATLLNDAIALVFDRLNLKGMKLKKEFDANGALISIDVEQMKMAITNILVNAVEAMEVDEGVLIVTLDQTIDHIIISITDNGKGIDKESLNTLFDPFYSKKQGGMGLGLTSTQNIIKSHGGHIDVESTVGVGTTFYIHVPKDGHNASH